MGNSSEVFIALIRSVKQSQANLAEAMEAKYNEDEQHAEVLIKELERDILQLKERKTALEQLSHSDDYVHLLQVTLSFILIVRSLNLLKEIL